MSSCRIESGGALVAGRGRNARWAQGELPWTQESFFVALELVEEVWHGLGVPIRGGGL